MKRFSTRKIEWGTIYDSLDVSKKEAKKIVSHIQDVFKKLGIDNLQENDYQKIIDAYNQINLADGIDNLDEVNTTSMNREHLKIQDIDIQLVSRRTSDAEGCGIIYAVKDDMSVITEFGNYDLAPLYELAYDIYSGIQQRVFTNDNGTIYGLGNKVAEALALIENAKDGDTYRRDILTCEGMKMCFIPIDIINIGAIRKGIRENIPYMIGYLAAQNNEGDITYHPYSIEITMINGGKQYLNEASLTLDDPISLKGCQPLSMHVMRQAFQDDPDDFRDIIDCSINCIMRALLTRINRDPSFDRKMYYDGMFNAEYKDDAQWKLHQEVAPDVHPEWFNRNQ